MSLQKNVLHDVPDYEERKKLLETYKNRLEALLSPCLTSAFNGHLTGKKTVNDDQRGIGYF